MTHPLEIALAEVDVTIADLELAIPRLTLTATYGERTSSGSKTAPVPVNVAALDAKHALHKWLMDAALRLGEPLVGRDGKRLRSAESLASHLICHLPLIEANGWADEWAGELRGLLNECANVTVTPGERINVGECGYVQDGIVCDNPLNPYKDQHEITCKVCGTVWNVKERQRDAIGGAWLAIDFPPVIIRALADYGITIKPKDFENWVAAGHLQPAAEHKGRKQYRVNEVWSVARRMKARKRKAA